MPYRETNRLAVTQPAGFGGYSGGARRSMDDEQASLAQSAQMLGLAEQRAKLEDLNRKTVMSAYAIHHFASLNPTDPDFKDKWYAGLQAYHEGLGDRGVQEVMAGKQRDYENFLQAQNAAMMSHYSGPEQDAYNQEFAQTQNPLLAHTAAMAVREQNTRINNVLASPLLTAQQKQSFNQNGVFDINGAERAVATAQGVKDEQQKALDQLYAQNDHLTKVRDSLLRKDNNQDPLAQASAMTETQSPDQKAAIATIDKQLASNVKQIAAMAAGQAVAAPANGNANDPLARLLGMNGQQQQPQQVPPASQPQAGQQPPPASVPVRKPVTTTQAANEGEAAMVADATDNPVPGAPAMATAGSGVQLSGIPPVQQTDEDDNATA